MQSKHLLAEDYQDTKRFEEPDALSQLCLNDDERLKEQLRILDARQREEDERGVQPDEHWVAEGYGEQPAVDLYVYRPQSALAEALPVLYFMHCGGYLLGHAREYGEHLFQLAEEHKAVLVSVEYRTARIAPYPADLNDAYHGLRYLWDNAERLGLDTKRFVLFGESAGGGLAARLALKVRDEGEIDLAGQVLIYPMLDCRTGSSEQPKAPYTGEFFWNETLNQLGWKTLRAEQTLSPQELAYFSPSLATNLSALPPTFIMCGTLDLFAQESLDYAKRLHASGVPCDMLLISGVYHSFEYIKPQSPQSALYTQARQLAVRRMFLNPSD
ncbi:MAG: alpha/beta hydrolase [Cardiobacteriaceae bacterium]|nr:alpha/beta hydrolase [Cardiobacteriaceae bacterium]